VIAVQFRKVLTALELLANGAISSYNSSGGDVGERENWRPRGEGNPPHLVFLARWNGCVSDDQRKAVLRDAESELQALRKRQAPRVQVDEKKILEARILENRDWPAGDVAQSLRCSVTIVRKVRLANNLTPERGVPVNALSDDPRLRAQELLDAGLTQRQVRFLTGIHRDTIRKDAA
jgi:hypothetical protein